MQSLPEEFCIDCDRGDDNDDDDDGPETTALKDDLVKTLLELCDDVESSTPSDLQLRLRAAAAFAQRKAERHRAELSAMKDVLYCELTDREANAARISDRMSVLHDRMAPDANVVSFERGVIASDAIEEQLVSLELHCRSVSSECGRLLKLDAEDWDCLKVY